MTTNTKPLVIYHDNCPDGMCAAVVADAYLQDAEFLPAQYGNAPPDVTGREVFILDFSYPRAVLEAMNEAASALVVLDHHKTAEAALKGLDFCRFDTDKSGGRMAAEWFAGREGRDLLRVSGRWLIDYTEDRDLWLWRLPYSRETSAALASYPRTLEQWRKFRGWVSPGLLFEEGRAILRYQNQLVESIASNAGEIELDGHKVLSVNTGTLISEVAGKLAEGRPFGVAWFQKADGKRVYSLRSRDGGIDVSEIAKRHGGGGHRNAAGFTE